MPLPPHLHTDLTWSMLANNNAKGYLGRDAQHTTVLQLVQALSTTSREAQLAPSTAIEEVVLSRVEDQPARTVAVDPEVVDRSPTANSLSRNNGKSRSKTPMLHL
jgi:hypothetical protein